MAGLSHTLDRFGLVWTILVSWVLKAGILKWFAIPFSSIFSRNTQKNYTKKRSSWPRYSQWCDHLKPDILECKVKWALGSITMNKASRGDGIPAELFRILNDDAVQVLHSICQQIWKTQQWLQDWKRSVFIPIPQKAMPNIAQTTTQFHLSHTLAKKYLKFSKPGFNGTWTVNFQMYKLDF